MPPGGVEGLEEHPEAALRDGVGAAEGAAGLQHGRDREVRSGEGHRRPVAGEVLAVTAEPGHELTPVEPEENARDQSPPPSSETSRARPP